MLTALLHIIPAPVHRWNNVLLHDSIVENSAKAMYGLPKQSTAMTQQTVCKVHFSTTSSVVDKREVNISGIRPPLKDTKHIRSAPFIWLLWTEVSIEV